MTTRAMFDTTGSHERGVVTYDALQDILSGPSLSDLLPPGTIGDGTSGHGAGLPIGAIRRGFMIRKGRIGDYSLTATTYSEVDSAKLAGVVVCTGRPVRIDISGGVNKGTASGIFLSVAMDGVQVSGKTDGLAWATATGDYFLTGWTVITPRPGPRRFALIAFNGSAGTSTLYSGANDDVQLAVTEL